MDFLNIDPFLVVYGFLSIGIGFIVKGMAGFGDPLVYNPLLNVFYSSSIISPAMIPVSFFSNIVMVSKNRKSINIKLMTPIVISVLIGDVPGIFLLKMGQPMSIKLLLGVVIVFLGIEMLTRKPGNKTKVNLPLLCIISFFSGVTASLFSINLFFVAYLERVLKDRDEFRSSICVVFLCESVLRFILSIATGMMNVQVVTLAAVAMPAMFLGMFLGGKIDKKMGDKLSRRFIIYVFILGGLSTIIYSLIAILGK